MGCRADKLLGWPVGYFVLSSGQPIPARLLHGFWGLVFLWEEFRSGGH